MDDHRTESIRQAIASGEFQRAELLWNDYTAWIRQEIGRGSCSQARMAEMVELVEWSRRVVLCDRARTQGQLSTIWVASQYGPTDVPLPSSFRASL